jgi:hypothetical protein
MCFVSSEIIPPPICYYKVIGCENGGGEVPILHSKKIDTLRNVTNSLVFGRVLRKYKLRVIENRMLSRIFGPSRDKFLEDAENYTKSFINRAIK